MATTTERPARWFIRCVDCLSVMAVDGESPTELRDRSLRLRRDDAGPTSCGLCEGRLEIMGRVSRTHRGLDRDAQEVPCDARCTGAAGPCCNCMCGGENHGTSRVVTVQYGAGAIPKATALTAEAAKARAIEWREARAAAKAAIHAKYPEIAAKRRGEWIAEFRRYLDGCNALDAVREAGQKRTHKGRMQALKRAVEWA